MNTASFHTPPQPVTGRGVFVRPAMLNPRPSLHIGFDHTERPRDIEDRLPPGEGSA